MRQNFYRAITTLLTLIVNMALFAQQCNASSVGTDRPLWKLDLGSAGLAKQPNLYESPLAIDFVDSATLVVAWFVSHPRPSPGADEPATLKVAYINASTGKVRSKSEWIASSRPLKVYITPAGNLLVRTGQTLHLFSPELKPLNKKDFTPSAIFGLTVSPDGARALVCPVSPGPSPAQLLDTDTLQVLDAVPIIVRCGDYLVGTKSILAWGRKDSVVLVKTPGEPWHPLLRLLPANETEATGRPYILLNENVLAVKPAFCGQSFSILTTEGKTLSTWKLPKGRCWGDIASSRRGQYFGALEERFRGIKNETLDMYPFPSPEQFAVYSLADLKEVFRINVEGISPWFPKRLVQKYAISPDGGRVAVMSNGVVKAYAVH